MRMVSPKMYQYFLLFIVLPSAAMPIAIDRVNILARRLACLDWVMRATPIVARLAFCDNAGS